MLSWTNDHCMLMVLRLDEKTLFFTAGLREMQAKLHHRAYTSVSAFSAELSAVLQKIPEQVADGGGHDYAKHVQEVSKVAKRILHQQNAGGMLREALKNESELAKRPYEQELTELEAMLNPIFTIPAIPDAEGDIDMPDAEAGILDVNGHSQHDITGTVVPEHDDHVIKGVETNGDASILPNGDDIGAEALPGAEEVPEITLPGSTASSSDLLAPLHNGGIPWYFDKFDPSGITIYDERWDGAERAMSAELSEMDEDELTELGITMTPEAPKVRPAKKASNKMKRKRNW